jgi:hypothetical protein
LPGDAWRQDLAEELIARARSEGVQLAGPGGLLTGTTKMVLETALETELSDHLGYNRGDPAGRGSPNMRNGHTGKTVHTDAGPARIAVPRDRAGNYEPLVVPKHARRVGGSGHGDLEPLRQGPDHRGDPGARQALERAGSTGNTRTGHGAAGIAAVTSAHAGWSEDPRRPAGVGCQPPTGRTRRVAAWGMLRETGREGRA